MKIYLNRSVYVHPCSLKREGAPQSGMGDALPAVLHLPMSFQEVELLEGAGK